MPTDPLPTAFPQERQQLILQRLEREGRVLAAKLAQEWSVSEDTIRRDLRELAAAGLCQRVYRGAIRPTPRSTDILNRQRENQSAKQQLAAKAVELVSAKQFILLDAGSVNLIIAKALPGGLGLTVITNSPLATAALLGTPELEVVLVGGALNHRSGGIGGPQALQFIQALRVDLCFLGACAVDVRHGLSAWDAEEAVLKRAMVEASGETAVAATADKLGAAAPFGIAPIGDLDHLVVEAGTPPAMAAAFQEKGVRVHFASAWLQQRS